MAQDVSADFKQDPQKIEAEVLKYFNLLRTNPAGYSELLRAYRGFYHDNIVILPGSHTNFETEEGTVPVDEAIEALAKLPARAPLEPGQTLREAAIDHVQEQSVTGRTGHFSADGSGPAQRTMRHGGGAMVAEVIAYGAANAEDVIRQLIIDDGVRDRGHRTIMLQDHLRYAGVACGTHIEFGTLCVIDLADSPDGRPGGGKHASRSDEPKPTSALRLASLAVLNTRRR